jgi:hypothetical protein
VPPVALAKYSADHPLLYRQFREKVDLVRAQPNETLFTAETRRKTGHLRCYLRNSLIFGKTLLSRKKAQKSQTLNGVIPRLFVPFAPLGGSSCSVWLRLGRAGVNGVFPLAGPASAIGSVSDPSF